MSSPFDFPPWDHQGAFDFEALKAALTRENTQDLLRSVPCPRCGVIGQYQTFVHPANSGMGITCAACGAKHPFMGWGLHWIPKDKKVNYRSNDIAAVIKECGNYCYGCGLDPEDLALLGFALTVHHTRPRAIYGDDVKKIPLCTGCHEPITALQRIFRKILSLLRKQKAA
jgi:hypothetical protein